MSTPDMQTHWQALYDTMRTALNGAGASAVPIFHGTSQDAQTGEHAVAPFVLYRQDTERAIGTMGGGHFATLEEGWVVTAYAFDLEDGLDYISAIASAIVDIDDPSDAYTTIGLDLLGVQTVWEQDFRVYGIHLRFDWALSG